MHVAHVQVNQRAETKGSWGHGKIDVASLDSEDADQNDHQVTPVQCMGVTGSLLTRYMPFDDKSVHFQT